jgi:hypothetical protein
MNAIGILALGLGGAAAGIAIKHLLTERTRRSAIDARVAAQGAAAGAALARSQARRDVAPVQDLHTRINAARDALDERLDGGRRTVLAHRWGPWAVLVSAVLSVLWVVLAFALFRLDTEAYIKLGHDRGSASMNALLLVGSAFLVGAILAEAIGLTHFIPFHRIEGRNLRVAIRTAVAAVAIVLFIFVNLGMHRTLGIARADAVYADKAAELATVRSLAENDPELLDQVTVLERELEKSKPTLRNIDSTLPMIAAGAEALTSWAPMHLMLLVVYFIGAAASAALRFVAAILGFLWTRRSAQLDLQEAELGVEGVQTPTAAAPVYPTGEPDLEDLVDVEDTAAATPAEDGDVVDETNAMHPSRPTDGASTTSTADHPEPADPYAAF